MTCLFISCVSNEFANYRDAIRRDLSRPNLEAKIQEDFNASGGATLEKLDDYIKNCEAVIHISGDMTGSMANEISVQYINNTYKDFGTRFPELQPVLNGTAKMSYTQWEAWLAIYHGKRLFIAAPTAAAIKDSRYIKDTVQIAHQLEHVTRLRERGFYDEIHFDNEDYLIKQLYRSRLGDILNTIPGDKPANLPYQTIGSAFKGRENFMEELHKQITSNTSTVNGVAIYAMGGMGKTRLAVEYALRHKKDYTALLFVSAASPQILTTNIANLSAPGIIDLPEYTAKEESIKYAAVMSWLNQYPGWLLILDNADTTQAVEKVEEVFAQLQTGHVLITSRKETWSQQIKKKRLDVLSKEDAITFLMETTNDSREKAANDFETAETIAKELGYLALALEQARAYINTKELSFNQYHKKWKANSIEILAWVDKQQMKYDTSVATTWLTSFEQLSPAAVTLLNRLSWLSTDPIPKNLLETEVPGEQHIDALSAWQELKQYSLATSSEDKKTFTIHKLVQDIARDRLNDSSKIETLKEAINWMNNAFNGDPTNVNDWPLLEPLLTHVLMLFEYESKYNTGSSGSRLMNDAGLMFLCKAQYIEAEPLMIRSLKIDEDSFGPNHPDVAINLNNLALLFKATNRLQEAEPLMRRALQIDEDSFGPNHPNVARGLNNLAQLLKATNRLQEAEPLMRRALQIDEDSFGPNHPKVAIRLNNLAQLLQATNRLQEAEPLMKRALQIDEDSFGPNHPNVAIDLNNLAQLLQATNRRQEAEPLMKRALQIDEDSFGPNHPNVAIRLNNLAQLLKVTNRLQEAEPLMKRALIVFLVSLGHDHPNTQVVEGNYVSILEDMGKSDEEIKVIFEDILKKLE